MGIKRPARKWHAKWLNQVTNNGEMVRAWCIKVSKDTGEVRCKYCKLNIKYSSKGCAALTKHAETARHIANCRLFQMKSLKAKLATNGSNKKPSHPKVSKSSSSSKSSGGHNNNKINKLKVKHPGTSKHIIPSVSKKSPISTLPLKFSVPILSKNFLQFKKQLPKAPHIKIKNLPCPSSRKKSNPPSGSVSKLLPKLSVPPATARYSGSVSQQYNKTPQALAATVPRSPALPVLSISLGNRSKLQPNYNQVYLGSNLRATGPPPLGHGHLCKLIPVFMCYFCHEEFPSKSSLYQHQAKCTMKLSAESLTTSNVLSDISIPTTDNESCLTSKDSYEQQPPTTPVKLSITVSNIPSPQKQNNVCKSGFLNHLGLLPKKTALQKQRKISRKRRNTECESLDWEEEDFTPKTPCTPPTPKLLISHLSREEHKRDVSHHRVFRLSSSDSWKKDVDKDGGDKDVMEEWIKPDDMKREHEDGKNVDKNSKCEGKISVARSLYNVDVTSPLGQFVIKHYRADPSLHILSDIESHCLTVCPTSNRTTNCCLRARHDSYPVTFMTNGKRSLFQNYFHQYKFNKKQVKDFLRRVNTGLDQNSRQLLKQMKKCYVLLRHITKTDLRHWISSQNNITVNVKPLTATEIAYWTMPKPTPSEEPASVFPDGMKFSSPNVKNVLGLKSKKEVRIKTVDVLHPSILNISHFVSEEACADLLMNQKTIYRSLLSDSSKRDSENFDVSHNLSNTLLRRMLSVRPVLGGCWSNNTLPDITNLAVTRSSSDEPVSKLSHIKPLSKTSKVKESPKLQNPQKHSSDDGDNNAVKDILEPSDVKSKSKLHKKPKVVCDVSCASFVNPKPSNLPRGEIPVGMPKSRLKKVEQISDKLRKTPEGKKIIKPHSIKVRAPSGFQDILSVEDKPHLIKSFQEHMRSLKDQPTVYLTRVSEQTNSLCGVDCNRQNVEAEVSSPKKPRLACKNDNRLNGCAGNSENYVECKESNVVSDTKSEHKHERASRDRRKTSNHKSRRKSSPRVTRRVKLGLNKRLSAAGLIKREDPYLPIPIASPRIF